MLSKNVCTILCLLITFLPRQAVGLGAPQTINGHPLPSPDRHNKSVHTVCSCGHSLGSIPLVNIQSSSLWRLHVCNFHTAILVCVVDNVLINFLPDLRGCSGFFIFWNYFFTFSFSALPFFFIYYLTRLQSQKSKLWSFLAVRVLALSRPEVSASSYKQRTKRERGERRKKDMYSQFRKTTRCLDERSSKLGLFKSYDQ